MSKYDTKNGDYFVIPVEIIAASSEMRDLIPVYIQLIKRKSHYDNEAYMIMNNIIEASGRKLTKAIRAGCDAHMKIITCLEWLQQNQYIDIVGANIKDIYSFGLTKLIKFKVNNKEPQRFILLYVNDIDCLLDISQQYKMRYNNLLSVYCYMVEHIYSNSKTVTADKWKPEVFNFTPAVAEGDLNISKLTLNKMLTALVDKKMLDRYVFNPTKADENTYFRRKPIYAIHEDGVRFNSQIALALKKVKEVIGKEEVV